MTLGLPQALTSAVNSTLDLMVGFVGRYSHLLEDGIAQENAEMSDLATTLSGVEEQQREIMQCLNVCFCRRLNGIIAGVRGGVREGALVPMKEARFAGELYHGEGVKRTSCCVPGPLCGMWDVGGSGIWGVIGSTVGKRVPEVGDLVGPS